MAKFKVYFNREIRVPKSGGGIRKYKAKTKYTINEDLYNLVAQFCDVLKIKNDSDNWQNALNKKRQFLDDTSKGIKKAYQVAWS